MKGSFRDLLDAAPDAMIVVNSRGRIVLVNIQTEKLFGYQRDELLNKPLEILIPPRFRQHHDGKREQFFGHPKARSMGSTGDLMALRKDGSEFPADISLSPVETEDGIVVLSSVRDVTERKKHEELARRHADLQAQMAEEKSHHAAAKRELEIVAERNRVAEALRRSEARLRHLADSNIIGISTGDLNGKIVDANEAFSSMLGFTREELLSSHVCWDTLTPPEYREADRLVVERLMTTGVAPPFEKQFFRKDGSRVSVLIGIVTLVAESGETEATTFVLDISEQKKLERQLRQAQKMEAVGQLAGGIAHDFNNLLGVIIGYSEILELKLGPDDPLRSKADQIKEAGKRAAALTRQLLAFSRKQVLEPKVLDLNTIVADTLGMLQRLIGEDIELVADVARELGRVKADRGQIEQVIMNLAVNARDAMPCGGKLTISTANVQIDAAFRRQHPGAVMGPCVMLSVTDTGCGMDEETQSHVFEPFFTTKAEGKGTGLGLATVYGVVKQTNGYISVDSVVGQGTSFNVYLPRIEEAMAAMTSSKDSTEEAPGSETILLVEDAKTLRDLTRELLEANGYTVLDAANGPDAIRIAEEHHSPIHILLTDVVMPGMDGRALADRITRICAGIKVVYMSGYTDDFIVHLGVLDSGVTLIQKPFTREGLLEKVREILGTRKVRPAVQTSQTQEKGRGDAPRIDLPPNRSNNSAL
jgi:PAS domain S-box-containing protein